MARYISRLYIVVEAESDAEAADAMSACLSETLKYDGHIVEWAYTETGNVYDHPMPLVDDAPDDLEEADMDFLFVRSKLDRDCHPDAEPGTLLREFARKMGWIG